MTRTIRGLAAAASIALFAGAPAIAQDTTSPETADALALFDTLDALNEEVLSADQQTALILLAKDVAVTVVCKGFSLDEDRARGVLASLDPPQWGEMSTEEQVYFRQHTLVWYGMAVGAAIATAAGDVVDTCAIAEAERGNPDVAHFFAPEAQ